MATCNIADLIADACQSKFTCLDEKTQKALVLQLLCNLSQNPTPPAASQPYALVQYQEPQGVNSGDFLEGDWRQVLLNTEVHDTDGVLSLSGGNVLLAAGTYRINGWMTSYRVNDAQSRLLVSNSTPSIIYGGSFFPNGTSLTTETSVTSLIAGVIVADTDGTQVNYQARCLTTRTGGFGRPSNFGTEVYASLEFFKLL